MLGRHGAAGTAVLALVIIFSTVNAYTAGTARVALAVAQDGGLPRSLARVDPRTGVPARALTFLYILALAVLAAYRASGADLQTALLIPSGSAILVYVVGLAAGLRLLRGTGAGRAMPWTALVLSEAVFRSWAPGPWRPWGGGGGLDPGPGAGRAAVPVSDDRQAATRRSRQ